MPEIKHFDEAGVAYSQVPFRRDQDRVVVRTQYSGAYAAVSVVDGWNNPREMPDDSSGTAVADLVSVRFPELFLNDAEADFQIRARNCALKMDEEVLDRWPTHASCVGAFLFSLEEADVLVAIGSVTVWRWRNGQWEKPREIGDYGLDPSQYPSDVSRFIGRGELKGDPFYSAQPDVVLLKYSTPVFIATDGFDDLYTLSEFNALVDEWAVDDAQEFVKKLLSEIQKRKYHQKDDISILLRAGRGWASPVFVFTPMA